MGLFAVALASLALPQQTAAKFDCKDTRDSANNGLNVLIGKSVNVDWCERLPETSQISNLMDTCDPRVARPARLARARAGRHLLCGAATSKHALSECAVTNAPFFKGAVMCRSADLGSAAGRASRNAAGECASLEAGLAKPAARDQ
eukprot:CAMPEP_0179056352 /NCGR_PEP_ID=MMETSP0796-20121207/23769_1 /TAXON_ID=73915 /ORGANISM="Pyrodinium bahamense, Strain pbaha01" /LENGTH=145 /DNA_ID=CAMNT_0020753027 /DNA_START=74 /DNA_END=511 /DNA_ORIENTATION=+